MSLAMTIRLDDALKAQATDMLDSIGLRLNAYVNLAIRQLVNQRQIPFSIVAAPEIPNEETRRAMVLAEAKELGIVVDEDPAFSDVDLLMASLEED